MLDKLDSQLKKLISLCISFPKWVIATYLILLIILCAQFKPFQILITADDLVNKDFKSYQNYQKLKSSFDIRPSLNIFIQTNAEAQLTHSDFCLLKRWRNDVIYQTPLMSYSLSPLSLRRTYLEKTKDSDIPKLLFPKILSPNCTDQSLVVLPLYNQLKKTPWHETFSANNGEALFSFVFAQNNEFNFQSQVIPKIVADMMAQTNATLDGFKKYYAGEAAYYYHMAQGLKFNGSLNIIISILVLIFFKFFLGTWKSGLIFISSLVVSSLYLFSLMSLSLTPIDILNNALFLLLTVSTMGDFIYLSITKLKNPHFTLEEVFHRNVLPGLFTSLTTFIGFISLCTSDLDIVIRLGFWAAMSGVIEWLVMFTLLPALLSLFNKDITWIRPRDYRFLKRLENIKLPKSLCYALLVLILLVPWSLHHLNVNDAPDQLFDQDHAYSQSVQYIKDTRGYAGEVSLVFPMDQDHRVQAKELINKKLEHLESFDIVKKVEAPYEVLDFLHQGIEDKYIPLIDRSLEDTIFYKRLIGEHELRAVIYLKEIDLQSINQFQADISEQICKDQSCYLSGLLVTYSEFAAIVPVTLMSSLRTSLLFVLIILVILGVLRKESELAKLILSSFWGVAAILVIIALTQVKINFVTCVVISTLVGLTGDNAIHFLFGAHKLEDALIQKDTASIITALIMAICSLTFLVSAFAPPRIFGVLLCVGFLLSLMGDLYLLKGMLGRKEK